MLEELEFEFDNSYFTFNSSQQFATIVFDICYDKFNITVSTIDSYRRIKSCANDKYQQYNPSSQSSSTCVYVREQDNDKKVVKICTIQHKGKTLIQIYKVNESELKMFDLL